MNKQDLSAPDRNFGLNLEMATTPLYCLLRRYGKDSPEIEPNSYIGERFVLVSSKAQ